CLVHLEPVQSTGGSITPPAGYFQGVREICDRYDILLCADEVITGFGRLGYWFGSERYDIRPDIVTCAKGLSSSYASIGAVIATDRVMEPFLEATSMYAHGMTFGGHPVMCAIALKNIEIMKRERVIENVQENEVAFKAKLETLLDLPIVGDVRGTGFFWALELVKDKETRETFTDEECDTLLRDFLSPALYDAGLICRTDDRGDPVIQISPPLVAGETEIDESVSKLGDVLAQAWERMGSEGRNSGAHRGAARWCRRREVGIVFAMTNRGALRQREGTVSPTVRGPAVGHAPRGQRLGGRRAAVEANSEGGSMENGNSGAVVGADEITRVYGSGDTAVQALQGVSVEIEAGRLTAVMGPSGSGKSTLMHILAGLDQPTSGTVTIAGTEITSLGDNDLTKLRRGHIGFVFQFFNLLPMLTAKENVLLPLTIAGEKPENGWFDDLREQVG